MPVDDVGGADEVPTPASQNSEPAGRSRPAALSLPQFLEPAFAEPAFAEPAPAPAPPEPSATPEEFFAGDADEGPDSEPPAAATLLESPRDGVPPVTADETSYRAAIAALAAGTGPVSVDAERASGHRYGQRAFLVQLRREGAGTFLIDPVALPDLSALNAALADVEWILHAANQDLPCLAELGMAPSTLFDTELGGRLAGLPRVGLAAMLESLLGLTLAKEHSAVDWSTRPLPEPWLRYAALDVEVLDELRDRVAEELQRQGKLEWALEEFAAVAAAPPPAPRVDPWRRTSGLHKVRDRRGLATVRELWLARDEIAQERDVSPGRILPDVVMVDVALAKPDGVGSLLAVPGFASRGGKRHVSRFYAAVQAARDLAETDLPPHTLPGEGPPPPRVWPDRDPEAAARLSAARAGLTAVSERHTLPIENLLTPDLVRRLCWSPPADRSPQGVAAALAAGGARQWQIDLTANLLSEALHKSAGG